MIIKEIHCRSILTRAGGYLAQVVSHSLNPYIGCGFGRSSCGVACYVQFNPWIMQSREWGRFVDVKVNADEVYRETASAERAWAKKRGIPFSIFLSSSTDPWQPAEQKYHVTKKLLFAMIDDPPDVLILQTHTDRIVDDAEYILKLPRLCNLRIHISIEGDRDSLPGLPPPPCSLDKRLQALVLFSKQGIATVACLSPLYPLRNPDLFFQLLASEGVGAVILDHFILGDGTEDGNRTLKTELPKVMAEVNKESILLSYRDRMANIARNYLPVGVSSDGFAGKFTRN